MIKCFGTNTTTESNRVDDLFVNPVPFICEKTMAIDYGQGISPGIETREIRQYMFTGLMIRLWLDNQRSELIQEIHSAKIEFCRDWTPCFKFEFWGHTFCDPCQRGEITDPSEVAEIQERLLISRLSIAKHLSKKTGDVRLPQHILEEMQRIGGPKTGTLAFPKDTDEPKQPTLKETWDQVDNQRY